MAVTAPCGGRCRHLALFYHGHGEYLAALGGLIRASRARGDAVLVAVPGHKAELVRRELADDSAQVTMVDMTDLGRNPARIIPAVLTYASQQRGRHRCPSSASRSGPAAGPLRCKRRRGMRRS